MLNDNEVIKMAMQNTLHALADPTRREILNLLKQSRMSAGDIVKYFSISGAAISRHLSVLKEAGLIRDEREGKFIYYELNATVLDNINIYCDIASYSYWITFMESTTTINGYTF